MDITYRARSIESVVREINELNQKIEYLEYERKSLENCIIERNNDIRSLQQKRLSKIELDDKKQLYDLYNTDPKLGDIIEIIYNPNNEDIQKEIEEDTLYYVPGKSYYGIITSIDKNSDNRYYPYERITYKLLNECYKSHKYCADNYDLSEEDFSYSFVRRLEYDNEPYMFIYLLWRNPLEIREG